MSSNKWLKRIFSIEFAALVVAIIAAYFAYIPIKDYFFDDNSIVASIYGKEIDLSTNKEKCDTLRIIAYTYDFKQIPISHIMTLKNVSSHVVTGLNLRTEYYSKNINAIISDDWKYIERKPNGSASYRGSELPPYGEIACVFPEISLINYDYPGEYGVIFNTLLAYEGCKKEKYITMVIGIYNIDVSDIIDKKYGSGTQEDNTVGFNTDFIYKCVDATYKNFKVDNLIYPDLTYVYLNTLGTPWLFSIDDVKKLHQEMK